MAYFELKKLNFANPMSWNRSKPNCNGNRHEMWQWGPPTTKLSNSRLSTYGQVVSTYDTLLQRNRNWAAQNLRLGRGLDIAGLALTYIFA